MVHCCKLVSGISLISAGVLIMGVSLFAHFWLPGFVKQEIKKSVSVTGPKSTAYKSFRNATEVVDLFEAYYVFHVENNPDELFPWAQDHASGSYKTQLRVTQKGPYVFRLNKYKPEANISWRTDGQVFYMAQTAYTFVPEMSVGDMSEVVQTYRVGMLAGMKHLENTKDKNSDMFKLEKAVFVECICGTYKCESWLKNSDYNPLVNVTVKELLLGYDDAVLTCVNKNLFGMVPKNVPIINQPDTSSSSTALSGVYSGGKYSSTVSNPPPPNKENEFSMYLGQTQLPYWNSSYANMLNGSGGDSLIPGTAAVGHETHIFVDDFLRSVKVVGIDDTLKLHDVSLVRYTLDHSSLEPGDVNPDNKAFYIQTKGIQPAAPNVESPVFFSKPYYLDGDAPKNVTFLGEGFDLLQSNPEQYNVFLDYEPHTGALLRVNKRIQASVSLAPHSTMPNSRYWPNTIAPVFWVDEYYTMSKHNVDEIKTALFLPLTIAKYGGIVGAVIGAVILLLGLLCCKGGVSASDNAADCHDDDQDDYLSSPFYNHPDDEKKEQPSLIGDPYDGKV